MGIFKRLFAALKAAVTAFPGGLIAVLDLVVTLAARFGLHLTADELIAGYAVILAAVSAYVHSVSVPKALLGGRK